MSVLLNSVDYRVPHQSASPNAGREKAVTSWLVEPSLLWRHEGGRGFGAISAGVHSRRGNERPTVRPPGGCGGNLGERCWGSGRRVRRR